MLIQGCFNIGLISELGYKHLNYIRDIRNFASAAHPNTNEITGLQLVTWLDTCIKEVLSKKFENYVLETRKLIKSIKSERISVKDSKPILKQIQSISINNTEYIHSLLKAIFGIYTDKTASMDTKRNIKLIAKTI
jgi:hypothetical protein